MKTDRLLEKLLRPVEICAGGAGLLALVSWLGWLFHDWKIAAFGASYVPMAPSTALSMVLLGGGVFFYHRNPASKTARRFAFFAAFIVGVLSLLIGLQHLFHFEWSMEPWLAAHAPPVGNFPSGRMSPLTAAAFLIAVFAFYLELPPRGSRWICRQSASLAALSVTLTCSCVVLSYAVGAPLLYTSETIPMALPTAISFALLGMGLMIDAGRDVLPLSLFRSGSSAKSPSGSRSLEYGMVAAIALLSIVFGIIGARYFEHQLAESRQTAQSELSAIADLKVEQILEWRRERLNDAQDIKQDPFLRDAVQKFFANPSNDKLRSQLSDWLGSVREHNQSLRALLLDERLNVRMASPADKVALGPIAAQYSTDALKSNRIITSDLHRSRFSGEIHFDLAIPLDASAATSESGEAKRNTPQSQAQGVLLFEVDPQKFLYPLIQAWPTPSQTAETILVRREGDKLAYLTDLRHRENTALAFFLPLAEHQNVPAVQAAQGREGVIEGSDYRGVPVLTVARSVPGTTWHLLAKEDQAEIYLPLREKAWNTAIILLVIFLATVLGAGLLWRRRDNRWFQRQLAAEAALRASQAKYKTLYDSSADALMLVALDGDEFRGGNPAALALFGFQNEAECLTYGPLRLSPEMQPDGTPSRIKTERYRERLLRDGSCFFEWTHRRLDGSEFPVTVLLTLMEIDGEKVVMSTVRDISVQKQIALALEHEATRYRTIMDASMDGIYIFDSAGKLLECNDAFLRNLGYTREEARDLCIFDWNAQWSREVILEKIQAQLNHSATLETRHRRKDGSLMDVEIHVTPMMLDGEILLCNSARDITNRIRAEAALRVSEQRFMSVLHASQDAILLLDGEKFIECNEATCKMLRYASPEEFLLTHPSKLSPPTQPDGRNSFEKAEEMIKTAFEKGFHSFEWMHRKADGEDFLVAVSLTALSLHGKNVLQCHWRDITEEKKNEAAILRAKKEWESTFDVVPDIITILDKNHRVVRANKALAARVGLSPRECVGQPCYQLMHGIDAPVENCPHQKLMADGKYHVAEIYDEHLHSYFSVSVSPLHDADGKLTGSVHVAHDITARKEIEHELARHRDHLEELVHARTAELEQAQLLTEESNVQLKMALEQANFLAEEAKQASRTKSRFLASMSHELRTPLNGVTGMIELLCKTSLDERQRRFAEIAHESGMSLLQLINDILDFSKIEAGRLELDRCEFSLPQIVKDAVQLIAPKAYEKHLELVCYMAPECQRVLVGDGSRLQQILVNLLGNAVKFTAKGEVCLQVTRLEEGPGWIVPQFKVVDTGIGIPASRRDRLFQSFSQVDSSTTRKFGGSGLGLAISKSLVEAMGGKIGVESKEGVGSTFSFTVKIETCDAAPLAEIVLPAELRQMRPLVVVGNESLQAVLVEYFESWELHSEAVGTAAEAMARLENAVAEPIDLMVIDEEIAEGRNLAEMIRHNSAISQPLIIVLTPFAQQEEMGQRPMPANSRHIVKPICQSILFDAIVDLCSSSKEPSSRPIDHAPTVPNSLRSRYAGKARILLAEDNAINQMYCLEVLRQAGLESTCVGNGCEAVEAVQTQRYDLVLMDCHMPEMDGYEASWRICRLEHADPLRGHIPIIALTANAIKGDREVCLEAGMDDYLSKPFEGRKLIEMIDRLLDKRTAATRDDRAPSRKDEAPNPKTPEGEAPTLESREGEAPAEPLETQKNVDPPATRQEPCPPENARSDFAASTAPPAPQSPIEIAGQDPPPIDFDGLMDRCMGNADFAASMLDELKSSGLSQMEEIARQIQAGAAKEAGVAAHALKGAAGILCAKQLQAIAFQIESAGKADDIQRAASLLHNIQAEMRRCLDYLPIIQERFTKASQP